VRSGLPGIRKKGLLLSSVSGEPARGTVEAAADECVRLELPDGGPWDIRIDLLEDALRLVRESYAWREESIRESA
jgi:hypothetical protein